MNCTESQSLLSELVDGTLPREAKAGVEAHLDACADCRALLHDLRQLRESARALPKRVPPDALWQKVRADFENETGKVGLARPSLAASPKVIGFPARRRPVVAALAAAAALLLATSAGVYYAGRAPRTPDTTSTSKSAPATTAGAASGGAAHAAPPQNVQSIEAELDLANQHYENAIAGLEKVAKDGQAALDPQVAAVLQKNIGVIDQAIGDSRAALRSQPTSEVAQASLFEALQRKVGLLRDTIALINEMRKGDQAGAAKIVGSLGKS
jgi:anti-sigma factor RsiW